MIMIGYYYQGLFLLIVAISGFLQLFAIVYLVWKSGEPGKLAELSPELFHFIFDTKGDLNEY